MRGRVNLTKWATFNKSVATGPSAASAPLDYARKRPQLARRLPTGAERIVFKHRVSHETDGVWLHAGRRRSVAKKRITKVYTRTGDEGTTSLVGGRRVSKDSLRVHAYGEVDELNSVLGIARKQSTDPEVREIIRRVQNDLFLVGSELAAPEGVDVPTIGEKRIEEMEATIDRLLEELEPLKEFILPGGAGGGPYLHLARAVARRCERAIVRLTEKEGAGGTALKYMNRLSDLLFVLARIENKRGGVEETYVRFDET